MGWFCFSIFDNLKTIISYYQWGEFQNIMFSKSTYFVFLLVSFCIKMAVQYRGTAVHPAWSYGVQRCHALTCIGYQDEKVNAGEQALCSCRYAHWGKWDQDYNGI